VKRYGNASGDSGVVAYGIGEDFIKVRFTRSEGVYVYDFSRPGAWHVRRMKRLAAAGEGLATYISQYVKDNYARLEAPPGESVRVRTKRSPSLKRKMR
jgi:hypothetical protein